MSVCRSFDALSRSEPLWQHHLLEASAGTGKTFAIEQIVVRALIEGDDPPLLEHIAVVTFTRAATRDLRQRLQATLLRMIAWLEDPEEAPLPDYLAALCEMGPDAIYRARQRLQHALYTFASAQISTLHAFCQRLLSEHQLAPTGTLLTTLEIHSLIRDFLCTELDTSFLHPIQLGLLWHSSRYRGDTQAIINAIADLISNGWTLSPLPDFATGYRDFCRLHEAWHQRCSWQADAIITDFCAEATQYREMFSRATKQLKSGWYEKVHHLAVVLASPQPSCDDFALLLRHGIPWVDAFTPDKRLKKSPPAPTLVYPELITWLREELWPLVQHHSGEHFLLTRLAYGCQQLVQRYAAQHERYTYDDLLKKAASATQDPCFCSAIQQRYRLAIVDEFQDTDPWQWQILERLFLNSAWTGALYLVGDPKQSIYAFRQADIYTYLQATEHIGPSQTASLDVNYRSHPRFLAAINTLFDSKHLPQLIHLPQTSTHLPYRPVLAGKKTDEFDLLPEAEIGTTVLLTAIENASSPRLLTLEEEIWLPYIAGEIHRLHATYKAAPACCAVLVKDRFQASRVATALKAQGLPIVLQRSSSLADSPAVAALHELLIAVLRPRDLAAIKIALGGRLLAWSHDKILTLSATDQLEAIFLRFHTWRSLLLHQGVAALLDAVLHTPACQGSGTVAEYLLAGPEPEPFFQDLWQLVGLLTEWQQQEGNDRELLRFFETLPTWYLDQAESLIRPADSHTGVIITTIHASKGLEYDIVFALGLSTRTPAPRPFTRRNGILAPIAEESADYLSQCHENDAEKLRQLYVATTRSRYRLYLFAAAPCSASSAHKYTCSHGEASPLELYLAQLCLPQKASEAIYGTPFPLTTDLIASTYATLTATCPSLLCCPLTAPTSPVHAIADVATIPLVAPKKITPVPLSTRLYPRPSAESLSKPSKHSPVAIQNSFYTTFSPWPILLQCWQNGILEAVDLALARHLLEGIHSPYEAIAAFICYLSLANRSGHLCVELTPQGLLPSSITFGNSSPGIGHELITTLALLAQQGAAILPETLMADADMEGATFHPIITWRHSYYFQRYWTAESRFVLAWRRHEKTPPTLIVDVEAMEKALNTYQEIGLLLPEQRDACLKVCHHTLTLITGGPGTGKTHTAGILLAALWQTLTLQQRQHCRLALAAPTGKAAAQLQHSLSRTAAARDLPALHATTLHALLNLSQGRSHTAQISLLPYDILLVDESSMIDITLMETLLRALKPGARLIFLGDHWQLPPVAAGSPFADVIHYRNTVPETTLQPARLERCLRTDLSAIIECADAIRTNDVGRVLNTFNDQGPIRWKTLPSAEQYEKALDTLTNLWLQYDLNDWRLLSPLRQGPWGVDALNAAIHKRLGQHRSSRPTPILLCANDHHLQLYNGEIGLLYGDYAVFNARHDATPRHVPTHLLPAYEYGYCLSIHKSQGSECNRVLIVLPPGTHHMGRELLYTAVTRARSALELWTDRDTLLTILNHPCQRLSNTSLRLALPS